MVAAIYRGVRNVQRNALRTVSVLLILSLVVALSLVMLLSRTAVGDRTKQVESDLGTTITVSPAGARGLQGGGTPLATADVSAIASIKNVRAVTSVLSDQVRTAGTTSPASNNATANANATTSLTSPIQAGLIGGRQGNGAGGATNPASGNTSPGAPAAAAGGRGGFLTTITVTGTTDPASTASLAVSSLTLVSGAAIDGASRDRVALVGTTLAQANRLAPGATFTVYGATITVAGVFDAGNTFANGGMILPLPTLQELSAQPEAVTAAIIKADSIAHVSAITTALNDLFGAAIDTVSDTANAELTLTSLRSVRSLSGYSLMGALFAGAVIIFLSMLMIVRERRREIGVLKAIGAPTSRITAQFAAESLTITLGAAVVGIAIGVVMANPVLDLMLNNTAAAQQPVVQAAAPGPGGGPGGPAGAGATRAGRGGPANPTGRVGAPSVGRGVTQFTSALNDVHTAGGVTAIGYGVLAAVLIALSGSIVPSLAIARVRPAEVMRAE